jgi:dienelactone hydrolase
LTDTAGTALFESDTSAKGVRERRFDVLRGERRVPGLLWTAAGDDVPRPVVMLGHGASGSKREDYIVALGRRLVRHHGLSAVAIDGPVHGDRRADGSLNSDLAFLDFAQAWSSQDGLIDDMVADWRAVLDAVQRLPEVSAGLCGYWGLSMGTIFGLPVTAAEPRVAVAVLGLMGISGPTKARFAADAARVQCPVLFLMQWHDELFAREQTFALFDALASTDRRLHAHPGLHGAVPAEEFEASALFLASYLSV